MKITAAMWEKYLTECGYEPGYLVMYDSPQYGTILFSNVGQTLEEVARGRAASNSTPLRIFTPDGKHQKGVDFVRPKGKREALEELLLSEIIDVYQGRKTGEPVTDLAKRILQICGVKDE